MMSGVPPYSTPGHPPINPNIHQGGSYSGPHGGPKGSVHGVYSGHTGSSGGMPPPHPNPGGAAMPPPATPRGHPGILGNNDPRPAPVASGSQGTLPGRVRFSKLFYQAEDAIPPGTASGSGSAASSAASSGSSGKTPQPLLQLPGGQARRRQLRRLARQRRGLQWGQANLLDQEDAYLERLRQQAAALGGFGRLEKSLWHRC